MLFDTPTASTIKNRSDPRLAAIEWTMLRAVALVQPRPYRLRMSVSELSKDHLDSSDTLFLLRTRLRRTHNRLHPIQGRLPNQAARISLQLGVSLFKKAITRVDLGDCTY
jgi:hypothetical protein